MKFLLLVLTLSCLIFEQAMASAPFCSRVFSEKDRTRKLESMQRFRLMNHNVEAFSLDFAKMAHDPAVRRKAEKLAEIILDQRPDVMTLQEVYSAETLRIFNSHFLKDRYVSIVTETVSSAGMNIGFLIRRDLDVDIQILRSGQEVWLDPVSGVEEKIFFREFPGLILRRPGVGKPALMVFATHGKSMADRTGDVRSEILRSEQFRRMPRIALHKQKKYGRDVPLIITGDFNADLRNLWISAPLKRDFTNAFDLNPIPREIEEKFTHTHHPHRGVTQSLEMDAFFVNPVLNDSVLSARTYRFRDEGGKPIPLPDSQILRDQNPSDHYPIVIDLDIAPLLHQ